MTQTVIAPGSGLTFVNTYTASDSSQFIQCIVAAEEACGSLWTNSITINLTFEETASGFNGTLATNRWSSWVNLTYDQLKNALPASDSLPDTDPTGGQTWSVPEAYARMLGLSSSTPLIDDTVTLNSSYVWTFGQDVINVIEHEISEGVMGRVGGLGDQNNVWSTMDLFRYSAPGVADYTNGRDGKATYFSSNATGLSSLIFNNEYNSDGTKNNQRDTADFVQADVFGTGAPGETNALSQTDIAIMDALGWKRGSVPLQGAASQYVIADDNEALYIQDMVTGRGGAQILPTAKKMQFTDGVGLFDPTGAAEDVARLYQAFLRRPPDVSGLAAWTTEIDESHVPLSAVANSFAASPEFIQASGGLSDDSFVRDMYLNALGRPMDAAGEQAWDNALASGMGRGEVALQFAESPEGRRNTLSFAGDKNDAETYRLYQAAFARTPDQAGQIYWSSGLASGATPSQVAQGFIDSSEFQQKNAGLGVSELVSSLYQNALHRAPDANGLQFWINASQHGMSEADVVASFADSLESRVQTASATHDSWVFIHA